MTHKKIPTTTPEPKAARPAGRADHAGRPFEKFLRTLTSALVLFRWAGDLFVTVLMQPWTRTLPLEGQEFKDWVSGRLYAAKQGVNWYRYGDSNPETRPRINH